MSRPGFGPRGWFLFAGSLALTFALLVPTLAGAEVIKVSERLLREGCDVSQELWQARDPTTVRGCAAQCFTAMNIVGKKARDHARGAQMSLWVSAGLVALLVAISFIMIGRHAGAAGWPASRSYLVHGLALVLVFLVGWGAHFGLYSILARVHAEGLFWDVWVMKHAGKTGASFTGSNAMTCADERLSAQVLADGRAQSATFQPFVQYPGTIQSLPALPTDRDPEETEVAIRFEDMTRILAAGEELDLSKVTPQSDVPTQAGPMRLIVENLPFPYLYPLAGVIGVLVGLALGFVIRRARS